MSIWVLRGLRNGVVTTRWPGRPDPYADGWRGPARALGPTGSVDPALCPAGAISARGVDQGRCILCGRCVAERPDLFAWSQGATGPAAAALTRERARRPRTAGDRRGGRGGPGPAAGADRRAAPQRARPARGRRVRRQRGVGDPGPARPGLRHSPAGRVLHRQPAARRRAAGHRGRRPGHVRAAAHDLRRDARSEGRHRGGHRRGQRRAAERERGGHRGRRRHGAGRCLAAGLPAQPVRHPQCPADRGRPAGRRREGDRDERAVRGGADPAGAGRSWATSSAAGPCGPGRCICSARRARRAWPCWAGSP